MNKTYKKLSLLLRLETDRRTDARTDYKVIYRYCLDSINLCIFTFRVDPVSFQRIGPEIFLVLRCQYRGHCCWAYIVTYCLSYMYADSLCICNCIFIWIKTL